MNDNSKIYGTLSEFQSCDFENLDRSVIKYSEYADCDIEDFQNVNQFIKHLPFFDKIKKNAFYEFEQIKTNLAKSIILNEIRPGLVHWTNRLQTFINEFGLFFNKNDHLKLIEIYLQIISCPDIDLVIVDMCLSILVELLKKYNLLTRDDLKIEWRPLYYLFLRINKIDEKSPTFSPENIEQISFMNFVSFARFYFDENSVSEMLEEWRPLMCPFDMSMNYAFDRFTLFLPSVLLDQGRNLDLWLKEFLDLWINFSGKVYWESNMLNLLSRVAKDSIGQFDWTPYIPYIFSKLLRGIGLSLDNEISLNIDDNTPKEAINLINNFSQTFAYSEIDIDSIGLWIVSMIRTGSNRNLCMEHIKQLFHILRSYFYPSNDGNLGNFFSLLQRIPEALIERIRFEKLDKYEWLRKDRQPESFIQDSDIEQLVVCMRDIVLKALFSKTLFNDAIKTYQYLCFLRPDLMLPVLIDQVYSSFESNVEPHRYTPLLACLVSVPRELVTFDEKIQNQKHILNLLISVLPGIDLNDLNKLILTFQFLTNILSHIIVLDCSPAIELRNDLSDYEKEICQMTSNFDDFVHTLFDKLFNFVDHLNNDNTSEVCDTVSQANYYSRINSTLSNENVTQVHCVEMFKVLISQSSKQILKLITDKCFKFINGRAFNAKSGDILAYLIGYLVVSGYARQAFELYFNYVYDNLMGFKKLKNFNSLLQNERVDPTILWNLHLFSFLAKANGPILVQNIDRIKEILQAYRLTTNKECISHMTTCYNNLITSLTKITPKETCSIGYNIIFDDSNNFFSKHLPIRDWGLYIDPKSLNIEYHIPNVQEISTALEITNSVLTESMTFLRKSILGLNSKKEDSNSNKFSKEDNYRELNYIYHVVNGASCLLKRPNTQKYVTEHIDSVVNIGLKEEVNKGLGFEADNIKDESHEYFSLCESDRNILLNMRKDLIEFCIKLIEKLVDDKSNDTIMLILLSRILSTSCSIFGMLPNEFEKSWKNHFINKSTIQNKLIFKKYPREELIRRVMLQYEFRCFHLHLSLNDLDFKVINILTNLSINSFYQIVRDEARNQLFELIGQYQYSSLTILPNIIRFLNKTDKKITIEQLEGCLLLLKGNNLQNSMLIKQNWFILGKLWPSLFKCKYFEHDMIQKLLDKIYFSANLSFNSFNNQIKLGDRTISLAYELSALEIYASDELRLKLFNQKCSFENSIISKLIEDLINIASDNSLSSKSQEISLFSLIFLLDSCKKNPKLLTPELTELFTKSLINENRNSRRISIDALCVLLKMTKYKKIITEYKIEELLKEPLVNCYTPGYRMDNECHLYDYNFNDWENAKYLDKSYWGYYSWPAKIQVPSNQRLIHSEEMSGEYSEALKPILKYFKNKNFIQKFTKLNQLESEKFDKKKFYFFKALFRNFGTCDIFVDLYENLTYLISDTKTIESSHKLAAEIISGLIRGSKYYALDELKKLWNKLNELFDLIVEKITSDTLEIWTDCFSNSFEDQDPRRMTFYLNYLKDGLNRVLNELSCLDTKTKPSFKLTNFLQLLTSLSQFEWKIPNFWNDIIQRLTDFMGHTNKLVREIIYSCAVLSTSNEVTYGKNFKDASYKNNLLTENYKSRTKNLSTFIDKVETKLNKCVELYENIHDESLSADLRKDLQRSKIDELISNSNFVQTILNWFILYLTKCLEPFSLETLRLFPLLSKLDKITSDETSKSKLVALRMYLPIWSMDQNCIQPLIEIIKQVSESKYWRSKQASLQMMRNFLLYNIFIFNETDKIELKEILLNLICDENLNVRLSACVTLTYLLHSNFFSIDNNLIEHFKSLSQIELNKIKDENEKTVLNQLSVAKRHGGVLGLCSIVNASPHEIPIYLPQIITYLADFTDDPEPIKDSVKKCLNDFKRTHFDNWNEHKQAFSDEQLSVLSDITIASSYYA